MLFIKLILDGLNDSQHLPSEWNTHVVVWRNKLDLDTISFDDLYNNFKIIEQEVKGIASSSSSSQNMAFVSSPSSTNEVNTAYGVSTTNTQVIPASTQVSTASTQLALLSMRTRRFFQKTGRKITINESDTVGYDKSKVECFNGHKIGHFARECRGPWNQDSKNRNQDRSRRTVNMEETSSKAMVAIDGAATYKRGLSSVEEQLVFYKKNKVIFCEKLDVLKRDISYKDSKISMLKSELEKLKQEKESNQLKIENFDNASKSLEKLIGSQINNKSRKGMRFVSYNVVLPPHTGLFSPPNLDLSYSSLEEFQQPDFEGYGPKPSKSVNEDTSNEVRESSDAPLIEELVSDEKKTVFPTVAKIEFVRSKQQEKQLGNQLSMLKCTSHKLLEEIKETRIIRSPIARKERVVSGNKYTRVNYNYFAKKADPSAHMNMVPRAVLMKTGLRPLNTARPVTTAHPKTTVYSARPMQKAVNTTKPNSAVVNVVRENQGHPQKEDQGYVDSGCSRHMTWYMSYLSDFKEFDGGYVTFGGGAKGRKITSKGTLKIGKATQSLLFTWVFFLASKDETSGILKSFITEIENLVDKKVKIIRCDNGIEFKNRVMSEFYEKKGIKKEFSVARTPQQNGVGEIRNRTLIEATRTMLADSKLPTTFWAEAVNTACYVQNKVLVVKPQSKTPYELFRGRTPVLSFMRPFGCHVTILNTLDYLGKFDGKFLKDKPIIAGDGPKLLFDIDVLTKSMNYVPVVAGTNSNDIVGTEESIGAEIDMSNITTTYLVPSTPNIRIHKDHSLDHVIGDVQSGEEPKKVIQALKDPSWIEAMQEELCSSSYKMFGPWWIYHMAKEPLGYTQEEGIDYDEVFGPVARIEAIRLFLAYESFKDFIVYQMDVKSAFLYGKIEEEVYVCQPLGIFRYLKGQPKLGLWYPKDSPFDLEAYTDSDYAGASLDKKSTTGGCQFHGSRLISWQCKKQTIVSNSTTEAEYVVTASCFKNLVFHSKTKHIEIRHHFIKDSNEKKLIQMIKIHRDQNVVDLLTKAFNNGKAAKDEIQVSAVGLTFYWHKLTTAG
ncbi:retrovirus-related pol polyprotein from transposon TNT 1-94 [Tanacetum coccineum]